MIKMRFILLALTLAMGVNAWGQVGEKSVGVETAYNTGFEITGLGLRFQYGILERLRIAPQYTYFIKYHTVSTYVLETDLHYLFPLEKDLSLYSVTGLGLTTVNWGGFSESAFGLNVGIGMQVPIAETLHFAAEYKTSILIDMTDQVIIKIAFTHRF